jgi:hypothetical protein
MREFAKGKGALLRERDQDILGRVGGPVNTNRGRNQDRSKGQGGKGRGRNNNNRHIPGFDIPGGPGVLGTPYDEP